MKSRLWQGDIGDYAPLIGEEAAQRIVQLLKDAALRKKLGARARDTVRERFLMTRKVEQYLDLFAAFEPRCAPDPRRLAALGAGAAGRAR